MNHMNDPSTRKFVGSKNLWKQICDGDFTPEDRPPSEEEKGTILGAL